MEWAGKFVVNTVTTVQNLVFALAGILAAIAGVIANLEKLGFRTGGKEPESVLTGPDGEVDAPPQE